MRTAIDNTKLVKQFLELAQPLPVKYAYGKEINELEDFLTFQSFGSPTIRKGIGNALISERVVYQVTIQTTRVRDGMIFAEMVKLATEGTMFSFISQNPVINPTAKNKSVYSIMLYLNNSIEATKVFTKSVITEGLETIAQRYVKALQLFGLTLQNTEETVEYTIPEGEYTIDELVELKKQYLDNLVLNRVLTSTPENTRTPLQRVQLVKQFLETVQPLKVNYGYTRGIRTEKCFITYQDAGITNNRNGIGNNLIGERAVFLITVQTETAQQNMFYSELIKLATEGSDIELVSEGLTKDTTVKSGWINSIIVYVYNSIFATKTIYTNEEVIQELQRIADRYIFITSKYGTTLAQSFIDSFKVPELEWEFYTYDEFITMKQEYLDRLLYKTTKY